MLHPIADKWPDSQSEQTHGDEEEADRQTGKHMAGTSCAYPAVMVLLTCRIWSAATSARPPGSCSYWSGVVIGKTALPEEQSLSLKMLPHAVCR